MRSSRFVVVGLVVFVTAAWAQDAVVRVPQPPVVVNTLPPRTTVDDVVARLLTFDANKDGRVTKSELNERMKDLLAKGDSNRDEALDADEIRSMVQTASASPGRGGLRSGVPGPGRGRFFDARPPAPTQGVQGIVNDLKLPAEKRQAALNAAAEYQMSLFLFAQDAATRLVQDVQGFLSAQQLADLRARVDRQPGPLNGSFLPARGGPPQRVFVTELQRTLDRFLLENDARAQAAAALKAYDDRLMALDPDGSDLVRRMQPILTRDELADVKAALERQLPIIRLAAGVVRVPPPPPPPAPRP